MRDLWESVSDQCMEKAELLLTVAPLDMDIIGRVDKLVNIALAIDERVLHWASQARMTASKYAGRREE